MYTHREEQETIEHRCDTLGRGGDHTRQEAQGEGITSPENTHVRKSGIIHKIDQKQKSNEIKY